MKLQVKLYETHWVSFYCFRGSFAFFILYTISLYFRNLYFDVWLHFYIFMFNQQFIFTEFDKVLWRRAYFSSIFWSRVRLNLVQGHATPLGKVQGFLQCQLFPEPLFRSEYSRGLRGVSRLKSCRPATPLGTAAARWPIWWACPPFPCTFSGVIEHRPNVPRQFPHSRKSRWDRDTSGVGR